MRSTSNIGQPKKDLPLVLHIISGLTHGGAEMMLVKLLRELRADDSMDAAVVVLGGAGGLIPQVEALGIPVYNMGINSKYPSPLKLVSLVTLIRRLNPVTVQTWMYHADLIGGVAARIAGVRRIIWNVRNSGLASVSTKKITRIIVRLCSVFSHVLPTIIVTNSTVAARSHVEKGYKDLFKVIPNGFDTDLFCPDEHAKCSFRATLGISDDTVVIGLIARFDPQKNHFGFLEAASILNKRRKGQCYLLAGLGVSIENPQLKRWIDAFGLQDSVVLIDVRDDMPAVINALDICTLCSTYGEGFPNVIGEAMACECQL